MQFNSHDPTHQSYLPSVAAFLDRLPNGVDSYPTAQIKGSVIDAMLNDGALERPLTDEDVPACVADLTRAPTRPNVAAWVPAVHYGVLMAAIWYLRFRGPGGAAAHALWFVDGNRRVFASPLYRILFRVARPERVVVGGALRWSAFHRGSSLEVINRGAGEARLRLRYPPYLFTELSLDGFGYAFRAACETAGGKDISIRHSCESDGATVYDITWR